MSGEAEKTERAYVYMVRCAGGQRYTGWTNDPASRLHAHKSGKGAKCTRALGAQRFAYLERCTDKSAALRREAALKKLPKPEKEALAAQWTAENTITLRDAAPEDAAGDFIDPEKDVETVADALQGANDIIAEIISDDADIRKALRGLLMRQGRLRSLAATEEDSVYRL